MSVFPVLGFQVCTNTLCLFLGGIRDVTQVLRFAWQAPSSEPSPQLNLPHFHVIIVREDGGLVFAEGTFGASKCHSR